jgi:hypothetical protein
VKPHNQIDRRDIELHITGVTPPATTAVQPTAGSLQRTVIGPVGCKVVVFPMRCREDSPMGKMLTVASIVLVAAIAAAARAQSPSPAPVEPRYDGQRALILPAGYQRWILAGTSLGLSYTEGAAPHPMFHETLIEPTAYQHFVETGEFREGTMLVLIVHGVADGAVPSRHGQYAAEVHGVEMAVKDRARVPEGWAYYAFGDAPRAGMSTAQPNPASGCYSCHSKNAARDNVFLQFYSLLSAAAPAPPTR